MTTYLETPTTVRIGPFNYKIGELSPMEAGRHGNFGWHHWPSLEIRYRADVDPQQRAHILMHEILHGIWYTDKVGREDEGERDIEEEYVELLAIGLCDLIRNNPNLIAWVSQTLAGDGETRLNAYTPDSKPLTYFTTSTNGPRTFLTNEDILA